MPSPAYLISRVGDPIFALFIGVGATVTRINREEKEQGRTTQQTIDAAFRYEEGKFLALPSYLFTDIIQKNRLSSLGRPEKELIVVEGP